MHGRGKRGVETFGQLVGGVVHDVNNLLLIARLYSREVGELVPDRPEVQDRVAALIDTIEAARELNNRLLEGRSAGAGTPETDVGAALTSLARLLAPLVPPEVIFAVDAGPGLRARIEDFELDRIVTNLVANALDVVEAGDRIEVGVRRDGDSVVVSVFDSGPGIAREYATQVFDPFFTTKNGGTLGLGLASVNWLVRRRGGTVTVASRPDVQGTFFEVRLPTAD